MKRLLLSLFLLFHVFAIWASPNPRSFLYLSSSPVLKPYLDFLGLNSSWAFFAPEPVFPPMYLDYAIEFADRDTVRGRFPEQQDHNFFRDRFNRRMSLSRSIMTNEAHTQNMFVPYLCREYPGASDIKLWRVTGIQPSFEMVRKGEKKVTDAIEEKIEVLGTFYCAEEEHAVPHS